MPDGCFHINELQEAIIDFYILSNGIPPQLGTSRQLQQHRIDVINAWRRTLIRDIEFCIACEIRHMADTIANSKSGTWENTFAHHFGEVGKVWYTKWNLLRTNPALGAVLEAEQTEDVLYVLKNNESNHADRKGSYIAAKVAEQTLGLSLIEVATVIFNPTNVYWKGAYGGHNWRMIAQTLLSLWHATDIMEIVGLIDTSFALHHNTSVVFTKNHIWAKGGSYSWIQLMLDYKWAAHSSMSLMGMASDTLQKAVLNSTGKLNEGLSPKCLALTNMVFDAGQSIYLMEDGQEHKSILKYKHKSIFGSYVIHGDQYMATKTYGKKKKQTFIKVYSTEELLERVLLKANSPVQSKPVPDSPPAKNTKDVNPEATAFANKVVDVITQVYTSLKASVQTIAVKYKQDIILGTLQVLGISGGFRFRLKGIHSPCRFYFTLIPGNVLRISKGLTREADFSKACSVLDAQMSAPSEDIITEVHQLLKRIIDKHVEAYVCSLLAAPPTPPEGEGK